MSENTLPDPVEVDAEVGVDLPVSALPELTQFTGEDQVMVISAGRNWRMNTSVFAAALAGSEVSLVDLNKKADKTAVNALEDRIMLVDEKAATKADLATLNNRVIDLDLSKVNRDQFLSVESRVSVTETRVAGAEEKATLQGSQLTDLTRRVAVNETGIDSNRTLASQGVDDAARAFQTANEVGTRVQVNANEIAQLKGQVDVQASTIARVDAANQVNEANITTAIAKSTANEVAIQGTQTSQSVLTGRVSTIEANLGQYALQADLAVVSGTANANTQAVADVSAEAARLASDLSTVKLDAATLTGRVDGLTESTTVALADINTRLTALTQRVDQLSASGDSLVPAFSSTGTVTQPDGYTGNNYSCSVVNFATNSYGAPLQTLYFRLEFYSDSTELWEVQNQTFFSILDGGGSVQKDVVLLPGATLKYRVQLLDRFRPGWIHLLKEFTYTAQPI